MPHLFHSFTRLRRSIPCGEQLFDNPNGFAPAHIAHPSQRRVAFKHRKARLQAPCPLPLPGALTRMDWVAGRGSGWFSKNLQAQARAHARNSRERKGTRCGGGQRRSVVGEKIPRYSAASGRSGGTGAAAVFSAPLFAGPSAWMASPSSGSST